MWLALNDGFLSIVKPKPFDVPEAERRRHGRGWEFGLLMVRARKFEHLKRRFPGLKVYRFKARDYPCRVFINRAALADQIADIVAAIDYTNFKDSVDDGELHDAYMGVWSVMHRYQGGAYKPYVHQSVRVEGDPSNKFFDEQRRDLFGVAPRQQADHIARMCLDADLADQQERWRHPEPDDEVCGLMGCTMDNPCMDCLTKALADHNDRTLGAEADRYGDFDDRDDSAAASHLRAPPK